MFHFVDENVDALMPSKLDLAEVVAIDRELGKFKGKFQDQKITKWLKRHVVTGVERTDLSKLNSQQLVDFLTITRKYDLIDEKMLHEIVTKFDHKCRYFELEDIAKFLI